MLIDTSQTANQVTPMAAYAVSCPCGFATDSRAPNEKQAIAEVKERTKHSCKAAMTATKYGCRKHQTFGEKCRECAK